MSSLNTSKKQKLCLAHGNEYETVEAHDVKRKPFKLKCPGSVLDACEKEEHVWHCDKCKKLILRDSDDYFYCDCGKSKTDTFGFKCSSDRHGPDFLSFSPGIIAQLLKEIPEVNVLLIGVDEEDTGEWLNTFANCNAFPTLQEAIDGSLIPTIPISFHAIDKNDVVHDVTFGTDSTDRMIRVNSFLMRGSLTRIIDVPGFRKCFEVENMKKNYQYLLAYLSNLIKLNCVCFLSKMNSNFELCFREFLNYFDTSVIENAVFCHRRHESLKTRVFLAQLLRANKLFVSLDANKLYNVCNGCFQYVYAVQRHIKFTDDDKKRNSKLWSKSIAEIDRLGSYFDQIKPHDIKVTLSMLEARKNVIYLSKAIAIALEYISRNIIELKYSYKNLSKVVIEPFLSHGIICKSAKCYRSDMKSTAICHDGCCLDNVTLGSEGDPKIKDCLIIGDGHSLNCGNCGCFWDEHVKVDFIQGNCDVTFSELNVEKYADNKVRYISNLENEKRKITEKSVKIGQYLTKVSIKSFSDQLLQHMQSLIKKERYAELLKDFIEVRDNYCRQDILSHKLNVIEMEEIEFDKLLNELYTLEYSGDTIKKIMELKKDDQQNKIVIVEEFIDLTTRVIENK